MKHYSERFAAKIIQNKETNRKDIEFVSPKYLRHFLTKYSHVGDSITIQVTSKKTKRTDQQNRYYWGVYLPLIAEETGEEDLDRLHELFKGMFLTETIAEVLGYKVRITKSTSDLSIGDFIEYIIAIEKFTEVEAPPTENYSLPTFKHEAHS